VVLVVVANQYGRSGGEVYEWPGTARELETALRLGRVMMYDEKKCPRPIACPGCGRKFISWRAVESHGRATARGEPAGCAPGGS